MTDNLGAGRIGSALASGQWAKADDMAGALDAALTNKLTLTVTSATETQTLTAAQFIGNFTFIASPGSPVPDSACTLNVPVLNAQGATLIRGPFAAINDLAQSLTVQVSGQADPVVLSAGQRSILVMDGTKVYLAVPQGVVGADGVSAGLKYLYDATTTTTADPGAGDLRGNSATPSLITEFALSDFSAATGNPSVEADLATWDDSTSAKKGDLFVRKRSAPENFVKLEVTAAVNEAGWWRFSGTNRGANGSWSASDALDALFVPKGDQGAGSTVTVEEENVSVVAAASILNFKGADFNVTDAGGGQADIALAAAASAFSGALVKKAADQTGANYTAGATVTWDAETYDVGGWHDNVTNNSRLTVPSGVTRVKVGAMFVITNITDGVYVIVNFTKNGADFHGAPHIHYDANGLAQWRGVGWSPAVDVTAGDYFETTLNIQTDGSVSLIAANCWFAIEKVD